MDPISLTIKCDPSELAAVREQVEKVAQAMGFPEPDVGTVMLAVDEALTNVIRHSYGGPCDEPIDICIERDQAVKMPAIRITIRDYGGHVDPSRIKSRSLEDVRPGGLGVHIIQTVMDEVTYTPLNGGGTQLIMVKKRCP